LRQSEGARLACTLTGPTQLKPFLARQLTTQFNIPRPEKKRRTVLNRHNINLSGHREHSRRKAECAWRSWYKSPIWKTIKRHRLVDEPNCRKCASEGKTVPASYVAHVEHHQGEWALFAKYDNTQSLCHKHLTEHRHSNPGSLVHQETFPDSCALGNR